MADLTPKVTRPENTGRATVTLLLGAMLLYLSITSLVNRYLLTTYRPWIGVTGAVLVVIALISLSQHSESEHQHGRAWLFLLVPLLSLALYMPSPLNAFMTSYVAPGTDTTGTAKIQVSYPPLKSGVNESDLEELSDRLSFSNPADSFGKTVQVVGFTSPAPVGSGAAWALNRFKLSCCAADAVGYAALVRGVKPLPPNTWVSLTARVVPTKPGQLLTLEAIKLQVIPEPKEPYL